MRAPPRRLRATVLGVGIAGGFVAVMAGIVAIVIVIALFGVQGNVQSFGAACQQYEDSINTTGGEGPGQGIYNPVMPAGSMYLPSTAALHEIPPVLMLDSWRAAARYPGYDWTMLAGQMYQETRYGQDPSAKAGGHNFLGYAGILQFGTAAWSRYGADGDGDGKKDLYNPADAAYGAANYMDALNIETEAWQALLGYSGSSSTNTTYPRVVLTQAARYRGEITADKGLIKQWYDHLIATVRHDPNFPVLGQNNGIPGPVNDGNAKVSNADEIPPEPAASWSTPPLGQNPGLPGPPGAGPPDPPTLGQVVDWKQCAAWLGGPISGPGGPGGPIPPTPAPVYTAVLAWARSALGTPYVWGAPRLQGDHPVSFDCSSFVQWAWYQATRGAVALPGDTHTQYPALRSHEVAAGKEQPGDLIFYGHGAALHHVIMVYDPRSGTGIEAPQTGDVVKYIRYNNAQHPHVWSDQVGIFRTPVPANVPVRMPPSAAQPAAQDVGDQQPAALGGPAAVTRHSRRRRARVEVR